MKVFQIVKITGTRNQNMMKMNTMRSELEMKLEFIENCRAFVIIVVIFICMIATNYAQSLYLRDVIKTESWKIVKTCEVKDD